MQRRHETAVHVKAYDVISW